MATQTAFTKWLDTLLEEKEIDTEALIEVEGPSGTNVMPLEIVIEAIKSTTAQEQAAIKKNLVYLDFHNASIVDYLKHLAKAIAI